MNRRRPDPVQRQQRIDRRATAREQARAKVQNLRDWHQARIDAAEKRRKARLKAKAKKAGDDRSRGVNRVPAHLQGLAPTEGRHLYGKRDIEQKRPLAQPEDLHPAGNYATRRARGQRGHQRPPRRRDLPKAVERRLERNRKAWLDA
jgi:hypothetical protein